MTATPETEAVTAPTLRTYSEAEAADKLGMPRQTLRYHRQRNLLRPDIVLGKGDGYVGKTTPVKYDAQVVDDVAAGDLHLWDQAAEASK